MDRETRNHILWLSALWVVFSALGEWLVQVAVEHWPLIASTQGAVTGEAIFFLMRATVPVFVIVALIIGYSMIRFRVPQDDTQPAEAQFATNGLFIAGWVGLSVILNVIFIIYPGIYGLETLWSTARAATAGNALTVDVTAKQWEWDFSYPDQKIETTDKLVVPVDRPIHFILKSDDVMHSFWAPAWGIKKAVIPGETRNLVVTPTKVMDTLNDPTMRIQCAQICGAGHPVMRSELRVVSAADFDKWVAKKQDAAKQDSGSMKGMDMGGMNMGGSGSDQSGGMKMQDNGSGSMDMGSSDSGNADMGSMNMGGSSQSGARQMQDQSGGNMNMDSGNSASGSMDMSTDGQSDSGMKMPKNDTNGSGN
ncbi:cytochrome c oxidase subunit II [Acidimangrovimonas pyrenivorans]|uniref:cytochrome-c oxidase n=1 Tax=Acidimangrovimonas pyrenivorans TaxID=2030798 RepID=A0ABV7AGR6_9RHOB